jgi:hypothetical protein
MGNLTDHFSGGGGGNNVLEYLNYYADGRTLTTTKGNIIVPNVTTYQSANTSIRTFPGTNIEYCPPDGTTNVYYKVSYKFMNNDSSKLGHFQVYLDNSLGSQVAIAQSRYTYYNSSGDYDQRSIVDANIRINGNEDVSNGTVGAWNAARTLEVKYREYNSGHTFDVNRSYHWNGAGSYANMQPLITIIATK